MKQIPRYSMLALLASGLSLLAGCVSPAITSPAGTPALPAATEETPVSAPATSAAAPSEGAVALPEPEATGTAGLPATAGVVVITAGPASSGALPVVTATTPLPPLETSAGSPVEVTQADNGRTIAMHVGDRFLLNLGEGAAWAVEIADPAVLSPVGGMPAAEGSQGLYEARGAGSTTLTATNEPPCRKTRPPCMLPTRVFEVDVIVGQ